MNTNLSPQNDWTLEETCFDAGRIVLNGSKFILGNGYMGYRGTLEEFRAEQLVANIIAGLYDKVGDSWREPVNAPNAFYTRVSCNGTPLHVLDSEVDCHRQSLNIRQACHRRETVFVAKDGQRVVFTAARFLSLDQRHLMAMEFSVQADRPITIEIETGIDLGIWDINGPHLESIRIGCMEGTITVQAKTHELGCEMCVAETLDWNGFAASEEVAQQPALRRLVLCMEAKRVYRFHKFAAIYTENDHDGAVYETASAACAAALKTGYQALFAAHVAAWEGYWRNADVEIEGDDVARFALRYSLYQLLAIAPPLDQSLSIPARGLSGQVYKGAVFWDTEMFMVPFFLSTLPGIAKSLLLYRYRTLDGARRKAMQYGYEGAFYAWESQETGDDACSDFNVSDVFTGRPMRTHFRDKQIHISGAVAYAFWKYYVQTGDRHIFTEGGTEVVLECARFFHSYLYYKPSEERYEFLDVVGPDEYHERVHNNAYTNRMARETFEIAVRVIGLLESTAPDYLERLVRRLGYEELRGKLRGLGDAVYMPGPDLETGVIAQFDGYRGLEDVSLAEVKSRILNPTEYLGGGNGLATTTQILKQADVILMLSLFGNDYSAEVKRANWFYYEPRTEHGSSLSACAYALVACEIGELERACRFFEQTSTIDLTGKSKQYIGSLFIGGTHPAANGGAWMVAINGFAGLRVTEDGLYLSPRLPKGWERIRFCVYWHGSRFDVAVSSAEVVIKGDPDNSCAAVCHVGDTKQSCAPGQSVVINIEA